MAGAGVINPPAGSDFSPLPSPTGDPGQGPAEVETEFEDDEGEHCKEAGEPSAAAEVEEDLESNACDESAAAPSSSGGGSIDYVLPERNREVWKNFGHNTEALQHEGAE